MQRLYYGEIIDGEIKLDNENEWDELYKKYAGQSVEISVRFLGKKRNGKQNRFYWKVVVNGLASYFGYTADEMHKALKVKFDVPSTSKLSVVEFSEYVENIIRWSEIEQGFLFPLPTKPQQSSEK